MERVAVLRYPCRMTMAPSFQLNGREIGLADTDPTESLLRWLKRQHHTGTKEGCADGDCGACTVALRETDPHGETRYQAVNSCLMPMGALVGRDVTTVEALADGATLHPVQQSLVDCSGSQCGYCTPGFVMSLFAGYYAGELDDHTTEGNLCRCTGYAPIRRATTQLRIAAPAADRFSRALQQPVGTTQAVALGDYFTPLDIESALRLKREHAQAAWIAGATDLGVNLSHGKRVAPAFIALDRIAELKTIEVDDASIRIGAGASLTTLESRLAGVIPALDGMLPWFAARQIKNRATLGGNLGSASPIGDLLPLLLALDATIELRSERGLRKVAAADYFLAYRKTVRADDELVTRVVIPRTSHRNATYKVAKRQTDDISIVAAVFALGLDAQGRVSHCRLAYGGVAAIPLRALKTEQFLLGRCLDEVTLTQCAQRLRDEFQPLSDHRAGAAYRRELCASLFARFIAEHAA